MWCIVSLNTVKLVKEFCYSLKNLRCNFTQYYINIQMNRIVPYILWLFHAYGKYFCVRNNLTLHNVKLGAWIIFFVSLLFSTSHQVFKKLIWLLSSYNKAVNWWKVWRNEMKCNANFKIIDVSEYLDAK